MDHVDETPGFGRAARYRIRLQGELDEDWSEWFAGLTVTFENGVTTLTGPVADQAVFGSRRIGRPPRTPD